ncbi:MAG: hypothetical protein JSR21_17035 [Proteobacteria bacterium]|nr:hypothetical protein [Pseudomonadota bacterium]
MSGRYLLQSGMRIGPADGAAAFPPVIPRVRGNRPLFHGRSIELSRNLALEQYSTFFYVHRPDGTGLVGMTGDKSELMAHVLLTLFGADARGCARKLGNLAIADGRVQEAATWQRAEWALAKLIEADRVPEKIPYPGCQGARGSSIIGVRAGGRAAASTLPVLRAESSEGQRS